MTYELIITEKPSAAMKIAYSLADSKPVKKSNRGVPYYMLAHKGQDIVIVPAVGHLFTIAEKKSKRSYPSFELEWAPSSQINKRVSYTKKYADTIAKLAKDAKSYTVACDYDVEGEVIGLNCVRFLCKKKDANRMKFSTLTKGELIGSYENKNDTLNWGQANAGETRHFLDWLYGINLSRALMAAVRKNGRKKTLSTGRVQGPALKIVVDKEKEIQDFTPEKYWQLELKGKLNKKKITAFHEKDRFKEEKKADAVVKKTENTEGKVKEIQTDEKTVYPPYAFDLTTLQTEAYRSLGISPKKTLSLAQNLYTKGYISYPRTSSQKLPSSIGYQKIIGSLKKQDDYSKICKEILEKSKIYPRQGKRTDPAHPAIFPTGSNPKKMKKDEKRVYDLIVRRFLSAFGDSAKRVHTKMDIDVKEELFIAKGAVTTEKGWYKYYGKHVNAKEKPIPEAKVDDEVNVEEIKKHEKETQPPRRYSPSTILRELENKNLGTKSTRAQVVDTLYHRNFIKGRRYLEATPMGMGVVEALSKHSPKIIDEELTKHFEEEMDEIRSQEKTKDDVLDEAKAVLKDILEDFKEHEKEIGKELVAAQKETEEDETIGDCPNDDGKLRIKKGKYGRFGACSNYPDCKTTYNLPNKGFIEFHDKKCDACKVPTVMIKFKGRKKQEVCINPKCPTKETQQPDKKKDCPKCKDGKLKLRTSAYGQFYGCSNYPKCKHTEKVKKDKKKE